MSIACAPTQHRHPPASPDTRACCGREWAYPYSYRVHAGHHARVLQPVADRFWPKVDVLGPDDCWPWTASTNYGYGQFGASSHGGSPLRAHRVAYELTYGPVPAGLDVDHQCHNRDLTCSGGDTCPHRRCCNPRHLDPATRQENTLRSPVARPAVNARKTHCIRNHPLSGDNVRVEASGSRSCRTCNRLRSPGSSLRRAARRAQVSRG